MSLNIVREYVDFTKDNFLIFTKKIMGKHFDKEKFNQYLTTYVNVRYYHQYEGVKSTLEANLNYYLGNIYFKDKSKTSQFILELFKMYYYLDDVKKFDFNYDIKPYVDEVCEIRESKVGIVDKEFHSTFKKMVLDMYHRRNKFINSLDSKDFYLDIKDVLNNRYYVTIKNTIEIPKLYSSYAIRRVWNSHVISEDTLQIELYLLSQVILRDVISGNFKDHYLVDFKVSLFSKKEKIRRTLDIVRNDVCLELISFNVTYQEFLENKDTILKYIHDGISFNVILDDSFLKSKSYGVLDIFKYIIITDSKYKVGRVSGKKNLVLLQESDILWILFLGFCMSF